MASPVLVNVATALIDDVVPIAVSGNEKAAGLTVNCDEAGGGAAPSFAQPPAPQPQPQQPQIPGAQPSSPGASPQPAFPQPSTPLPSPDMVPFGGQKPPGQ